MAAEAADEQTPEPRWLAAGPPYEFTREELLRALRIRGYPMTERRLRNWADRGLLPPPTRRVVPPSATDGVARALYPVWTIPVLGHLLSETQHGKTIAELQEETPKVSAEWTQVAQKLGEVEVLFKCGIVRLRNGHPIAVDETNPLPRVEVLLAPRLTRALQRAAWDYAADFAHWSNKPVKRMRITIEDEDGEQFTQHIPPPPPPRPKRRRQG